VSGYKDIDRGDAHKLVRGTKQRGWLDDLLDDGQLALKDYCNPDGSLDDRDWTALKRFRAKLEVAGYILEFSYSKRIVDCRYELVRYDPLTGRLMTAVEMCLRNCWPGCSIPHAGLRQNGIELRSDLATDEAAEVAIALLGTWPVEDINTDFADLVAVVAASLQRQTGPATDG